MGPETACRLTDFLHTLGRLPKHSCPIAITYDITLDCIELLIASPNFPPTAEGACHPSEFVYHEELASLAEEGPRG